MLFFNFNFQFFIVLSLSLFCNEFYFYPVKKYNFTLDMKSNQSLKLLNLFFLIKLYNESMLYNDERLRFYRFVIKIKILKFKSLNIKI